MKRSLPFLFATLAAAFLLFLLPRHASAQILGGACGAGVNWRLDTRTGVFTLSGFGAMDDYAHIFHDDATRVDTRKADEIPPWEDHLAKIRFVTVEDGVTHIGACAFSDCAALESVSFGSGLRSIGASAFRDCYTLSDLSFPESLQTVGASAFSGCRALSEIVFPESVTDLGAAAFMACTGLRAAAFGEGLRSVGPGCFEGDPLTEVCIPSTVQEIGEAAFGKCEALTEVTLTFERLTVRHLAFWSCPALERVTLRGSQIRFDDDAFKETNVHTLVLEGVTEFRETAFSGSELRELFVGEGVEKIGARVFCDCASLYNVTLPDGLLSIGYHAFFNTALWNDDRFLNEDGSLFVGKHLLALKTLRGEWRYTIRSGVHVAAGAFEECRATVDLTVEKGTRLDEGALRGSPGLRSVVFREPSAITYDVCEGSEQLIAVVLPEGITTVPSGAFDGCSALRAVVIPDSVKTVELFAFFGCDSLETVCYTGSRREWEKVGVTVKFDTNDPVLNAAVEFASPLEMPNLSETGVFAGWAPYAGILALIAAALGATFWMKRYVRAQESGEE